MDLETKKMEEVWDYYQKLVWGIIGQVGYLYANREKVKEKRTGIKKKSFLKDACKGVTDLIDWKRTSFQDGEFTFHCYPGGAVLWTDAKATVSRSGYSSVS